MNNKNDFIEKILNKKGKEKILIVLLIGILLMVIAIPVKDESKNNNSFIGSQDTNNDMYTNWLKDYNSDITSYSTFIEEKLKNILSKVAPPEQRRYNGSHTGALPIFKKSRPAGGERL